MKLNTKKQQEDLRGLFFIVKGQYRHHIGPTFYNSASETEQCLGGYNPEDTNTKEWYMLMDNVDYHCICCGADFEEVLRGVYSVIKRYKTKERYLHTIRERSVSAKVSKPMRCLYKAVYDTYGDYYLEEIKEMEDKAYSSGVFKSPLERSKDTMHKIKTPFTHVTKKSVKNPSQKPQLMKQNNRKKIKIKKLSVL